MAGGMGGEEAVDPFLMDRTEVTVDAYGKCVDASACTEPAPDAAYGNWGVEGREYHPVTQVTWEQARAFCEWRGALLPTEEEWQWAATGGDAARTYPWGHELPTCERAVLNDGDTRAGKIPFGCGQGGTWAVGAKSPAGDTRDGLQDMAGNVWEWTDSWPDADLEQRIIRGGGWGDSEAGVFQAAHSGSHHRSGYSYFLGFRCVRVAQ